MLPCVAQAQSVWGGAGSTTATTDYNTPTNWSAGAPTAAGSSAQFASTGNPSVNLSATVTPDSWTFDANSKSYTLTGLDVNFSNAATLTNNASAGQAISIANNMSGTTLSQAAASTLTLSGDNSFTSTSISAGRLVVANFVSLTSNVSITSGGTFDNNSSVTGTLSNGTGGTFNNFSGVVSGLVTNSGTVSNGGLLQGGLSNTAGTFDNKAFSSINGGVTITGGTLNSFLTNSRITGGLINSAVVNAGSLISGAIVNQGAGVFNQTGFFLSDNNTFTNNDTAQLNVIGGTFANLTTVTNNSTNAIGISVSAGRTLSATSLINAAGATVSNLGTITTTSITNSGTFRNNGTTTGTFTMAAGNLSGVGNTQSLTVNGGTFAPGNGTAGTSMTVTGSLVLQAAATYLVQVNPTTASFTNVTGAATLNGATVSANYAAGSYISKRYTIVTAASGVNGPFGALVTTGQPANLTSTLSYDINNAYLNLNLSFVLPGGVLNQNQQNVGNALTGFFNTTGGISMAFASLTAAQLTQSDGEVATGSQQSTFNAMNQFMGVMTDPFVAGRGDPVSAGGGATGYADEQTARRNPNDALAAIYRKAPVAADPFAQRWSVWAAGYGGSQTTSGNAVQGSNNTSSNLYGTAVGADYRLSPDALAGFALAGGGTNFSVANGLGSGRSDLFQAGAFVRHNIGAAYLSGALAYGWQDITTNRTLTIAGLDQLQAKFNANAWSGRVEGGYRFVTQGIGLTPYAAGQFTTFDLPAYAEQAISGANTFALAYGARSVTATRSELGLRTDKSFAMEDGVFTLRGRAAWAHDYNPDRAIGTTFQTLPGASFVVNGARQASDAVLLTASVEKKWLNGWSAAGTFEGEFSSVTTSYAGKGVVRYAW
ncbi:Uncharacterized conserved protein, contains a C-terminal beta-barrel porin domain [Bradyrhizobium lablabi]|nr:Uncharacterized conserved protein, contains a C-terminal beta-barrel porin domain [Bradyrhizobium lablabi]